MKAETPCKAMGYGKLIVFGLLPCCVGTIGEKPRKQQFLRRDSKIQIYSHEFSTESFFLLIAFCGYLCYLCDLT